MTKLASTTANLEAQLTEKMMGAFDSVIDERAKQ
jgi:hypothetical protein